MSRRRPVGLAALQKDKQRLELFQQKGTTLAKEELDKLSKQMGEFRTNLEKFAQKYKKDIRKNGDFRREFQKMCAISGVDPLRSSTNFWCKLLGVGDFYYELAVQIVEVFLSTNHKNGGIMTIEELRTRVLASRNVKSDTDSITAEDILTAIRKLKSLGSNIREIPSKGSYIIHSTPAELNSDHICVTQIAHSSNGCVSCSSLVNNLSWSEERARKVLDELIMEGIVWVDNPGENKETLHWFSGLN